MDPTFQPMDPLPVSDDKSRVSRVSRTGKIFGCPEVVTEASRPKPWNLAKKLSGATCRFFQGFGKVKRAPNHMGNGEGWDPF